MFLMAIQKQYKQHIQSNIEIMTMKFNAMINNLLRTCPNRYVSNNLIILYTTQMNMKKEAVASQILLVTDIEN